MTPFEVFIQQVINGFTTGSYLALIALGYTMVYGLIELINFAHGDVYALGFFISLTLFTWLGVPQALFVSLSVGQLLWMLPVVMLATMLCTGLINVGIDRLAYKPLRRAPRIAALITAVGASFALENIMQNWYGPSQILYPNIFPDINLAEVLLGGDDFYLVLHQGCLSVWCHHALAAGAHGIRALYPSWEGHPCCGAGPGSCSDDGRQC